MRRIMVNTALEKIQKEQPSLPGGRYEELRNCRMGRRHHSRYLGQRPAEDDSGTPAPLQMVFNLYAIEGYSHQEIGEMMKISEGTSNEPFEGTHYFAVL